MSLNDLGMNSVNFKKDLRDTNNNTRGSENQTAVFEQRQSEFIDVSQRVIPSFRELNENANDTI